MTGIFLDLDNNIYEKGFKSRTYELKNKLTTINLNLDIKSIKEQIRETNPNYIFAFYHTEYSKLEEIGKLGIPIVIGVEDSWRRLFSEDLRKMRTKVGFKGIATNCLCEFPAYMDYFNNQPMDIFWFKWGIDTTVMRDYGLRKVIDVFSSGKLSTYQFRKELYKILSNQKKFKYMGLIPYPKNNVPYDKYAKNMNKSYITLGGCLQEDRFCYYKDIFIGYTFMRNLEIPACGSCLLNTDWGDRRILGFEDGENCILFSDISEALKKIKYYLDNKEELNRISKNGMELVHKFYTNKNVVGSFVKHLERKYG